MLTPKVRRVVLPLIGMAGVAMLLTTAAFALSESERHNLEEQVVSLGRTQANIRQLVHAIDLAENASGDYLLTSDGRAVDRYRAALAEGEQLHALLLGDERLPIAVESALSGLMDAATGWRLTIGDPIVDAVASGDQIQIALLRARAADDASAIEAAIGHLDAELRQALTELNARGATLAWLRLLTLVFVFIISLVATGIAVWQIRRFGAALEQDSREARVLNRFTEVASFAGDDAAVAAANLQAIAMLVNPDQAVVHVLNASRDRALPDASLGGAIAEALPMHALSRCPGVSRGTIYVTDDVSAPLSVRCPVYPLESGTVACIPLGGGEMVGSIHLYWGRPDAFRLDTRAGVVRVAEHAALAIGNHRLLAALHGQATTDPRTGLLNTRAFDDALEAALASRLPDQSVSVLLLDLDHFKQFNDRHGHPAGDDALRAFAGVLKGCLRESDLAARYGGEEFCVLLPGLDTDGALAVAERIRGRTEATLIPLGPGVTGRLTVSIGVASAPLDGLERLGLLRLADRALYQAKDLGRNQVVWVGGATEAAPAAVTPLAATAATATRHRPRGQRAAAARAGTPGPAERPAAAG